MHLMTCSNKSEYHITNSGDAYIVLCTYSGSTCTAIIITRLFVLSLVSTCCNNN
jgi:hypothetical protein